MLYLRMYTLMSLVIIYCTGCACESMNFVGLTKEQIVNILEKGPQMNDGSFRILYPLPGSPTNAMVNHFHKNKESLLNSQTAMNAPKWQVFFHLDGLKWHSYLLTFEDGIVVSQEDRRRPHWTMVPE